VTASSTQYETLIGLVEHFSPSGQEAEAVDWLVKRMQGLGFTQAFVDAAGNAVGVMGFGEQQIVLLGHIDTVPGEIPVRIIDCQQEDGTKLKSLYGRGSVDAKGPLAAFVDAVAKVGVIDGTQFLVIGAIDEERESLGAREVVRHYQPDFAIIGEPSQWDRITLGYKGSAWAEIKVQRVMAHSAGRLVSAPEAAVDFWNQVITWTGKYNADRNRLFDQVQPTLRGFSSSGNAFQDTAVLKIGVRLPPDVVPSQWYDILQQLGSAADVQVTPTGYPIPAYRAQRRTPLVRAFLGGIRAAGGKPGFVVKTGTADLNIVAPVWDCPAVAYGPGDSSLDHTPDEHLLLSEYEKAVRVLYAALQRLCV
jgi:LysW-gamma-L-lysine carboxypeptidase